MHWHNSSTFDKIAMNKLSLYRLIEHTDEYFKHTTHAPSQPDKPESPMLNSYKFSSYFITMNEIPKNQVSPNLMLKISKITDRSFSTTEDKN